jgi:hypothetical protein
MKVRITLTRGKGVERPVVGEFDDLAGAMTFAGQYMKLAPGAHRGVTTLTFEVVTEPAPTSSPRTRQPAPKP